MNGPKQKLVNVDEVSVSTLSVEIKTISVGRRQMSMALFRQLPREPLIDVDDKDQRLNGMPWGRVNYHWDGCFHPVVRNQPAYEHVHVLWQRNNVLFQSAVPAQSPLLDDYMDDEREWDATKARYCRIGVLVSAITTNEEIKSEGNTIRIGRWSMKDDYQDSVVQKIRQFRYAPETAAPSHTPPKVVYRERIEQEIAELCLEVDVDSPDTEEEAWSLLQNHHEQFKVMRADQSQMLSLYRKRYEELLALEQLFIAA